jgi:uncharacterized membrane protein
MNPVPLHPAVVHLPLGLAMLMPALATGFAWAIWTGRVRARAWLAVVALQALLLATGLVALKTGGAEEERVEAVVRESAIHRHEEAAEQFVWAAGITLALAGLGFVGRRPLALRGLTGAAVVATLVVAGLGLRVGHAGGQLVYVHGAASAYAPAPSGAPPREAHDDDRRP